MAGCAPDGETALEGPVNELPRSSVMSLELECFMAQKLHEVVRWCRVAKFTEGFSVFGPLLCGCDKWEILNLARVLVLPAVLPRWSCTFLGIWAFLFALFRDNIAPTFRSCDAAFVLFFSKFQARTRVHDCYPDIHEFSFSASALN